MCRSSSQAAHNHVHSAPVLLFACGLNDLLHDCRSFAIGHLELVVSSRAVTQNNIPCDVLCAMASSTFCMSHDLVGAGRAAASALAGATQSEFPPKTIRMLSLPLSLPLYHTTPISNQNWYLYRSLPVPVNLTHWQRQQAAGVVLVGVRAALDARFDGDKVAHAVNLLEK